MAKRLGVVPYRYAAPLFGRLRREAGTLVELAEDVPAHLAVRLRERSLDAAFLSPIDYARDYAMYSILPDLCAASTAQAANALLVFREGLRTISTIAVYPASSSEIVLATIILKEQFDLAPKIVPFVGPTAAGLTKADAVLCGGDDAEELATTGRTLNLIEEWYELTGLPFVHGVWVTRPNGLEADERSAILRSGMDALTGGSPGYRYTLDDETREAMTEFFRMSYYQGVLADIPDLHLYREDDPRLESPL
jgi:predicted solute-binding protein